MITEEKQMSSVFTRTGRRTIVLLAALATLAALLAPGPAQAKSKRELTVMTQNLYLGASLAPALNPDFPGGLFGALPVIVDEFTRTDYVARSAAIADEIAAAGPDLIGLQEVALWSFATGQTVDFLDILELQLAARGLSYSAEATSLNAEIVVPGAVTFRDRDVILVNQGTPGLVITGSDSGIYEAQFVVPGTPIGDISFTRGWALVDGTFEGKEFRFVNTHLETEDFAFFQEAQAVEFLAGPADTDRPVIAVGDFNSAADGSTTDTYGLLTGSFRDTWGANRRAPGPTCCQASDLANKKSELNSRIDLVLTRDVAKTWPAKVVTDKRFQKKTAPFWASDHAGVVAVIQLG
ncbi:MAG: endonuclease/exonuclease/phosphatase family protein [Acidimicrobiia bacterium]|nr:endonuclease/exonuclease/phosphatase family protein [Acidimicrobiia bacterium]